MSYVYGLSCLKFVCYITFGCACDVCTIILDAENVHKTTWLSMALEVKNMTFNGLAGQKLHHLFAPFGYLNTNNPKVQFILKSLMH